MSVSRGASTYRNQKPADEHQLHLRAAQDKFPAGGDLGSGGKRRTDRGGGRIKLKERVPASRLVNGIQPADRKHRAGRPCRYLAGPPGRGPGDGRCVFGKCKAFTGDGAALDRHNRIGRQCA